MFDAFSRVESSGIVAHGDVVVFPDILRNVFQFPLHGTFNQLSFTEIHHQTSVVELIKQWAELEGLARAEKYGST